MLFLISDTLINIFLLLAYRPTEDDLTSLHICTKNVQDWESLRNSKTMNNTGALTFYIVSQQ